jgi:hypothetical protein
VKSDGRAVRESSQANLPKVSFTKGSSTKVVEGGSSGERTVRLAPPEVPSSGRRGPCVRSNLLGKVDPLRWMIKFEFVSQAVLNSQRDATPERALANTRLGLL